MTDRTFTWTIDQIKAIYAAGIRRGNDEQCAYDWGCGTKGGEYDELVYAIDDIINKGKAWGDPDHTDLKEIEGWVKVAGLL